MLEAEPEVRSPQRTIREIELEEFITHRPWDRFTHAYRVHTGRSRQTERRGRGHTPLLGSTGGILRCFWAKSGWSTQTKNSEMLVSYKGFGLSKAQEKSLEGGGDVITRATGEVVSGTYIGL